MILWIWFCLTCDTFLDLWHQYIIVIKVVLFHCNMGILQSIIIIFLKRKIQFLFLFLISCTIFLLSLPPIIWYRVLFFFFHLCHILFFFFHFCHLILLILLELFLHYFQKSITKTCFFYIFLKIHIKMPIESIILKVSVTNYDIMF